MESQSPRFPIRTLATGILLTLALFGLASWNSWMAQRSLQAVSGQDVPLARLGAEILHMDEVLTMSARMAAATGDLRWEERYQHYEPQLDDTIKEFIRLDPEAASHNSTATDEANIKLVAMEHRAFDLVREHRPEEAARLLFSDEYEDQKKIYADGTNVTLAESKSRIDRRLSELNERATTLTILNGLIFVFLGISWFRILKTVQSHLRARTLAESALTEAKHQTEELARTLEVRVVERTTELSNANAQLSTTLDTLHETQSALVAESRKAGMAEVATGVLHNVGNVLNSVTVTANLLDGRLRRSRVADLERATKMLEGHPADLAQFLTVDPKGKILVPFLGKLAHGLSQEKLQMEGEVSGLVSHLAHLRAIVSQQQQHARRSFSVREAHRISATVEEAIRINGSELERLKIEVTQSSDPFPPLIYDHHLVLQVLVNLVSNAAQAMDDAGQRQGLSIRTRWANGQVAIVVQDQGVGISRENLNRVFSHGFTTKPVGHGFGLHASALAAQQMGGSLVCESPGVGLGATFTLTFPAPATPDERPTLLPTAGGPEASAEAR